jgi:hypothetical protein
VANRTVTPPAELQLPVEIIGADVYGQQFFELARTWTIHRNGVSILLANMVAPDTELIVRNSETNEEAIAVVVGQIRQDDTGYVYGLAFLDPSANLWHLQFPAVETPRIDAFLQYLQFVQAVERDRPRSDGEAAGKFARARAESSIGCRSRGRTAQK